MTLLLITGSRDASPQMLLYARRVVERCADLGWSIIVGDAAGVDDAVIRTCCHSNVPFEFYGVTALPRHVCCSKHLAENYGKILGNYLTRDRVMADKCDRCIAIWNGLSVGTKYTFTQARKLGKTVDVIEFKREVTLW